MPNQTPRQRAFGKLGRELRGASVLLGTGLFHPVGPSALRELHKQFRRYGLTTAFAYESGAVRYPDRTAIIDELGELSYAQLDIAASSLARGLAEIGPPGRLLKIGLLSWNHRYALLTCLAAGKLGADLVLLNPSMAERQIHAVLAEQRVDILVFDEPLRGLLPGLPATTEPVLAWHEGHRAETGTLATVAGLIRRCPFATLPEPRRIGKTVLLTSGTTGVPKGAFRPLPRSLTTLAALLQRVPLRTGETMVLGSPLFHLLGFSFMQLAAMLGETIVLRREPTPETVMADVAEHRAAHLITTPHMLRGVTELEAAPRVESLRIVLSAGAPLPGPIVPKLLERFGPVLYNLYGSTEVSWATVAGPRELAAEPETVGTPPPGTRLAVLDEQRRPASTGQVGRIFIGHEMLFGGYTRPDITAETHDGMVATGDLGSLDERGRLFLSGRADDIVLVGSENVHPLEVERLLSAHSSIADVAAFGVPDEYSGQRVCVVAVPRTGSAIAPGEIRAHVARNLHAAAVPREVVLTDVLPRNASGKVAPNRLRSELDELRPARTAEPAPPGRALRTHLAPGR